MKINPTTSLSIEKQMFNWKRRDSIYPYLKLSSEVRTINLLPSCACAVAELMEQKAAALRADPVHPVSKPQTKRDLHTITMAPGSRSGPSEPKFNFSMTPKYTDT